MHRLDYSEKPSIFDGSGLGKVRFNRLRVLCVRKGRNGINDRSAIPPEVTPIDMLLHPRASRGARCKVPVVTGFFSRATFYFRDAPAASVFAQKVQRLADEHEELESALKASCIDPEKRARIKSDFKENVGRLHGLSPLLVGCHISKRNMTHR